MKIFISWSGKLSGALAGELREWLPNVVQRFDPWVNTDDVGKGQQWTSTLTRALDDAKFGLVCVTPDNLRSEWLHFEAGALAKSVLSSSDGRRVSPILLGVPISQVHPSLTQFQATELSEVDIRRLVADMNSILDDPLPESRLRSAFNSWWPSLEEKLSTLKNLASQPTEASGESLQSASTEVHANSILDDLVRSVRAVERSLVRLEERIEDGPIVAPASTPNPEPPAEPASPTTPGVFIGLPPQLDAIPDILARGRVAVRGVDYTDDSVIVMVSHLPSMKTLLQIVDLADYAGTLVTLTDPTGKVLYTLGHGQARTAT